MQIPYWLGSGIYGRKVVCPVFHIWDREKVGRFRLFRG